MTQFSLDDSARDDIADALNQALAETTVTTMLAQNFHWNVKGMSFGPLHTLFQTIYEDHFVGQDDLAERIKAVDRHAEGMLASMLQRSKVAEHNGRASDIEMLKALQTAEETLAGTLAAAGKSAADHGDTLTEDL
jgi:starvation-inducible DNA-binding protein